MYNDRQSLLSVGLRSSRGHRHMQIEVLVDITTVGRKIPGEDNRP